MGLQVFFVVVIVVVVAVVVIHVIGFVLCFFLWVGLINKTCVAILASSWLGWACSFVMVVLNFFFL